MRLFVTSAAIAGLAIPLLADPLPSWNNTDTKARIIDFVDSVTDPDSPAYVTPADRIATFDNDGTLWAEKPVYFQLIYAVDQVARMAEADPSILGSDAMKAAAAGDIEALVATGKEGLIEVVTAAHSGMSVDEFKAGVASWLDSARHPDTGRPFDEMLYQPMLELLSYLRDEGFTTYIVSGGGIDFIRVFSEDAYNIPPNQVVGTSLAGQYDAEGDAPRILKQPQIFFIDDKEGKPVAINHHIGKRPILAGGNSDGDFQMLEWTTTGDGARLGLIVHHTDAEREYAYDRDSHVGRLDRGLDEAEARGWLLIDMAADWGRVWPE